MHNLVVAEPATRTAVNRTCLELVLNPADALTTQIVTAYANLHRPLSS